MAEAKGSAPAYPRLVEGLQFRHEQFRGEPCWVIEDPRTGRFFRLGVHEYNFLSRLDGQRLPTDLLAAEGDESNPKLRLSEAEELLQKLAKVGLLQWPDPSRRPAPPPKATKSLNPFFIRIPLGNPDRLMGWLADRLALCFTPICGWLAGILMLVSGFHLLSSWSEVGESLRGVLHPYNWLGAGLVWIFLKIIHELAHGVVCKRMGGEVPEIGIQLILFVPLTYVDATSSWRFESKWQRIGVVAAGMGVEMLVAAAAAIVWCYADPGFVRQTAFNMMVMASLTTVLFNSNPLMRFDGYFILSDWLEMPNLMPSARRAWGSWALRHLFGIASPPVPSPVWLRCYGATVWCWQLMLCLSLILAASALLSGAGILLSLFGLAVWIAAPLWKTLQGWLGLPSDQRRRSALRVAALIGLLVLVSFTPLPQFISAPAVLDWKDAEVIRPKSAGFITRIAVKDGDRVQAGDLLIELDNPDARAAMEAMRLETTRQDLLARRFQQTQDIPAWLQQLERVEGYRARLAQLENIVTDMRLCAPFEGVVKAPRMADWLGRFAPRGEALLTVLATSQLRLRIAVGERDAEAFRARLDQPVLAILEGRGIRIRARLDRIGQEARTNLIDPALGAQFGGPLPVAPPTRSSETYQLLEPRFEAEAILLEGEHLSLCPGELATVRLVSARPLWQSLHDLAESAVRWLLQRSYSS